jgi:threonine/homoserine/homoserine lactone efflux protein
MMTRRTYLGLTFFVSILLAIILPLTAGSKDIYWMAIIFTSVWFVYAVALFVSTFFSRGALKMRKSNYKKPDLN